MSLRRNAYLQRLLMIMFAICAFEGAAYAQFTVTVTGATTHNVPIANGTSSPAPSDPFRVKAEVTGNANAITKVVFYRNDVPYMTDTAWDYRIDQGPLGQDNYTYHARAYDSTGAFVDSNDYKLTFHSPQVLRMGDPYGPVATQLPSRYVDHTTGIQNAVTWLGEHGGGTLFFPCTIPPPPNRSLSTTSSPRSTSPRTLRFRARALRTVADAEFTGTMCSTFPHP